MTYTVQRQDRFYVVAYDGLDPLSGKERRRWHPVGHDRDEAAPSGGRVTIATTTEAGRAILRIADTGPDLGDDELPHLFERFWRGHAAAKAPGTGVGLAVVAELVAAHHGRLDAANRVEGGAEFTITLPSSPEHDNSRPSSRTAIRSVGVGVRRVVDGSRRVRSRRGRGGRRGSLVVSASGA